MTIRRLAIGSALRVALPRQPHGPREPRLLRTVQQSHLDWLNRYTLGAAPVATRPAPRLVTSGKGLEPGQP